MHHRHHKGFTLIEMLVALSIFTVLLSTLLWGFRQGLVAWEKGSKQELIMQRLLLRHNWLEQMLNQAVVADYMRYQEVYVPYFKGDGSGFSWITASPLMDAQGNIRPVAIKLQKTEQGYVLYYKEGDLHTDPGRGMRWSQPWIEFLGAIKEAKLSYEAPAFPLPAELYESELSRLEKLRYRNRPEWLETYDSRLLLLMPSRIKLHFIDMKNQAHNWFFSLPSASDVWGLEVYFGLQ